jgi:hypothetical protein
MQQAQLTGYVDIVEVRLETRAAACNQLLAEGWVLLGVYPLTTVAEMTPGDPRGEQRKQPQDTQRYVRRFVGLCGGKETRAVSVRNRLCYVFLLSSYGGEYYFWGMLGAGERGRVKLVGGLDHLAKYPRKVATSQESQTILVIPLPRPTFINMPIYIA